MKAMSRAVLGMLLVVLVVACQNSTAAPDQPAAGGKDRSVDAVATRDQGNGAEDENRQGTARPGYESPVPVIVTKGKRSSREADDLPEGCKPRQAAAIVATYVDAFNRGDQAMLDRLFVPKPEFQSPAFYALGEVYGKGRVRAFDFEDEEKDRLLEYFAERRRLGERLELLKVIFGRAAAEGEEKNTVWMNFLLSRHAPDLKPGLGGPKRLLGGKGGIDCETQTIFGWVSSMEMVGGKGLYVQPWIKSGDTGDAFCKEPPGWKPGESVIACT